MFGNISILPEVQSLLTRCVCFFSSSKYIRQQLKEDPGKFLIFAHHKNMVDAICITLDEEAVHYISIVGSTPANARAVSIIVKISFYCTLYFNVKSGKDCCSVIRPPVVPWLLCFIYLPFMLLQYCIVFYTHSLFNLGRTLSYAFRFYVEAYLCFVV